MCDYKQDKMIDANPLYFTKSAGFKELVNNVFVEPAIYQPTPLGVKNLCKYYSKKYNIDLQSFDLSGKPWKWQLLSKYFKAFTEHGSHMLDVENDQLRGIVLSHKQFHAVPFIVTKQWSTL